MLGELIHEARTVDPRAALREIVDCFEKNDLLTYASAISFQLFFALIPLALVALGLLGVFGLTGVWTTDVAPHVRAGTSPAAFKVIDDTVRNVLGRQQLFWASAGALIAIWEVSGAMRATTQVLNRIYETRDERGFWHRVAASIWLSAVVTVIVLAALAAVKGVPAVAGGGGGAKAVGWIAAALLLSSVVPLVVRFAPDTRRPLRWVSFGSLLVIGGWIGGSLIYTWYITSVADYGSLFGSLSVVIVTLTYIYVSSIVFLTGLQLDSLIRRHVERAEQEREAEQESPIIVARSLASLEH